MGSLLRDQRWDLPREERVQSLSRNQKVMSLFTDQRVGSLPRDQRMGSLCSSRGRGHCPGISLCAKSEGRVIAQIPEGGIPAQKSEDVVTAQA